MGLFCLVVRRIQAEAFGEVVFALNKLTKFVYTAINNLKSIASPFVLVVWTSVCSILTIFLQVCLLMWAGLLVI